MSELTQHFEMKLLTTSKEIGLRRLRSFTASLGGSGQVFHSYDDVLQSLKAAGRPRSRSIILHDHALPLTTPQLAELQRFARVFALRQPLASEGATVPAASSSCWRAEAYAQCSLAAFLESPVLRMSMTQLVQWPPSFHPTQLLRWGHATESWSAAGEGSLGDASQLFARGLCLTGEGRRLVEVFTHFLAARLSWLKLNLDSVTFGSDGLLHLVAAHCQVQGKANLQVIGGELRQHNLPISLINHRGDGRIELVGLFYPHANSSIQEERMVLVFNQAMVNATSPPLQLPEAG